MINHDKTALISSMNNLIKYHSIYLVISAVANNLNSKYSKALSSKTFIKLSAILQILIKVQFRIIQSLG